MRVLAWVSLGLLLGGCSSDVDIGGFGGGGDNSGGSGGEQGGSGGDDTTSSVGGGGGGDGEISIHLRASHAPVAHDDGLAGQTPTKYLSGVRSLTLYRDASDPNPVRVFDLGADAIEVSYADGADTKVATVRAGDLPSATFTRARVVHNHVRYSVQATMHANGLSLPGAFDNMQVLSDDSKVDGTTRDHGYYEYVFTTSGMTFPTSGSNAPTPEIPDSGGFSVKLENGEYAYYFPVNLPVDANLETDTKVVLSVNVHECFRWQDQSMATYATNVFDATPVSFEPVMSFGANSYAVSVE